MAVCKELNKVGKANDLKGFEQAMSVWLEPRPFNEVGVTTNTMKLQRFQAKTHYKEQIDMMYKEGPSK